MIKRRVRGDLIVISGPSATGKDTIVNNLIEKTENILISISMTTREKREYESDGKDYYFVSKEEFEKNIKEGNMLEYAIVHGKDYYGTPKSEVFKTLDKGKDVILVIDIQGAVQIKDMYPEAIFIFILPPSMKELKRRLVSRGTETTESMYRRFKSMYKEVNEISKYNYVIVNDDLEDAVSKAISIMEAEKCRVDRIEELDMNSIEEVMHEDLVDFNENE